MVALVRGINVGRANRVAMADLRQVAESIGWRDVRTILATGNIMFASPRGPSKGLTSRLAARLEKALLEQRGMAVRVVVLSPAEVDTVIREQPFGVRADDPSKLLVAAYVEPGVRLKLEALETKNWAPGALVLGTHAAYLWCPEGILASPLIAAAARATRDGLTSRNWTTWLKLKAGVSGH